MHHVKVPVPPRLGEREASPEGERVVRDSSSVDSLQEYALKRIRAAAQTRLLWEAPWLVRILHAWRLLGEETQMREWVAQNTAEDADLVRLLGMLVGVMHVLGGHAPSRRLDVSLKSLAALFDPKTLADRIERALKKPAWNEPDTAVLQVVQRALRNSGDDGDDVR